MMYRPFDGFSMAGMTAEDDKVLADYCRRDLDDTLIVDAYNRVFDANSVYIADVRETEAGGGLYCFYDFQ